VASLALSGPPGSRRAGFLLTPAGMSERVRALVVDDDDPIRTMLKKVVERENIEVDTARDGVEAIERLDADGYRLILLDLMMPRVDGFGVLQHMRERHPEKLACTIVATAVPESEIFRKFDTPVRVIPKPFDISRLLDEIRACVGAR
jgi:chemosensory pili system protein ChpA (sensor histidine kinase/response regulator)